MEQPLDNLETPEVPNITAADIPKVSVASDSKEFGDEVLEEEGGDAASVPGVDLGETAAETSGNS